MAEKYDNEFKVMIVGLSHSGIKTNQVSLDYDLSLSMIGRWKREYTFKSGDFTRPKEPTKEALELKVLKKTLKDVRM